MIRFDNFLIAVCAIIFVVSLSASALSEVLGLGLAIASLILCVIGAGIKSRRGVSLPRNIATAAMAGAIASCSLVLIFAAAFFVNRDNAFIQVHWFDREVAWWLVAGLMVILIGLVFGLAALIGHVVSRFMFDRQVSQI